MIYQRQQMLLVGAVAAVGVFHTIVPDHWVPIMLIARQRRWSRSETAQASLLAGTGHVLSTLLIALAVWVAGVAFAQRVGHVIDTVSSFALVAFGGWFALSAWRDQRRELGKDNGKLHGLSRRDRHRHDVQHHHGRARSSATGEQLDLGASRRHHKTSGRTALLLVLGSSPMIEGIPAFFTAGKYGFGLMASMAVVFAASTIATYVLLCVYSTARLQRVTLGPIERYGEVLSGALISLLGAAFWIWPVS